MITKKVVSLIVSAAFLLAMLPVTVRAASGSNTIDLTDSSTQAGTDWVYDSGTKVFTVNDGADVTVSGSVSDGTYIAVNGTATVTLSGASVNVSGSQSPLVLNSGANLTLILADGSINTFTANIGDSSSRGAGILAPSGTTLTIRGRASGGGRLTATGSNDGAGIGGGNGSGGSGGTITINGGSVTANSGFGGGAGIGGGGYVGGNVGDIAIEGGSVTAAGGSGSYSGGAGIGGAGIGGDGDTVAVTGGTVFANGVCNAQDIGYGTGYSGNVGYNSNPGTLSISGGAAVFLANDSAPTGTALTLDAAHAHERPTGYAAQLYGIPLPASWSGATGAGAYIVPVTLTYAANGGSGTAPDSVTQHIGMTASAADGIGLTAPAGDSFSGWKAGDGTLYRRVTPSRFRRIRRFPPSGRRTAIPSPSTRRAARFPRRSSP